MSPNYTYVSQFAQFELRSALEPVGTIKTWVVASFGNILIFCTQTIIESQLYVINYLFNLSCKLVKPLNDFLSF